MTLNTAELKQVTSWVAAQKINYIDGWGRINKRIMYSDVQHEMIDHIASSIEDLITKDGLTFNEAFDCLKHKWNSDELKKLEAAKTKSLKNKYYNLYLSAWKKMILSPYVVLPFLIGYLLFKLLMIDEYWFSEVQFIVACSCLLFGLLLIISNMIQTEKINGKGNRYLLNALSFRIIAVLTGLNAIISNFIIKYSVDSMNFFNVESYDFYSNSIKLSFFLTIMICNAGIVYYAIHRKLKIDLQKYVTLVAD